MYLFISVRQKPTVFPVSRLPCLRVRQGRSHVPVYDTDHMRMHVKDACLHYIRVYAQLPAYMCAFSMFWWKECKPRVRESYALPSLYSQLKMENPTTPKTNTDHVILFAK